MALRVVSMDELKLEVLLEPERTGHSVVARPPRRLARLPAPEALDLPASPAALCR